MEIENSYTLLWRNLRSGETQLVLRIGMSVAAGAMLAGLAVLGAFALELMVKPRLDVEEWLFFTASTAAVVWMLWLRLIWGVVKAARTIIRPIIGTLVVGILTVGGLLLVDWLIRHDEEIAMGGIALCGGALVVYLWTAALHQILAGRPVIGRDNQVDVHCPGCGYSLIGLSELRCPECGQRFTIDELIRAQHYTRAERRKRSGVVRAEGLSPVPESVAGTEV